MRILVLGSAAGGGFPQWNCNCPACRLAWARDERVTARSQSSLAVSADGEQWLLLNASPDLRQQIIDQPALHPKSKRQSPVSAVFVTNADVDHIAGLLTLREQQSFTLFGSKTSLAVIEAPGVFGVLNRSLVNMRAIELDAKIDTGVGLFVTAFAVPGKVALYLEGETVDVGAESETTIGLEITD